MRYLFDNCISFRFANMLAALEVEAVALRESFDESVEDTVFLASIKGKHDVYITYDHKQKSRRSESLAIKEAGVTALWLGPFWGKKTFWDQAKWIITGWEKVDAFAGSVVPGTCAEIRENGRAMVFTL